MLTLIAFTAKLLLHLSQIWGFFQMFVMHIVLYVRVVSQLFFPYKDLMGKHEVFVQIEVLRLLKWK